MNRNEPLRLGFGCLRLPRNNPDDASDVNLDEMKRMVDAFIGAGFRYFETAYSYLNRKSECFVREALTSRYPRDRYELTTKLPCLEMSAADSPERYLDEQLEKCGVDWFDGYLLHSLDAAHYALAERAGWFEFLQRVKQTGRARRVGFSFHDTADVLDRILTAHPEVDVVQLQLNYLDWENPIIQSRACYEVCVRHGKPVIVMEPVKGGTLANPPEAARRALERIHPDRAPADWALRFAAGLPGVTMVLSGMSDMAQLTENMRTLSRPEPLTDAEREALARCGQIIRESVAIPCTGCAYCAEGCPRAIPIPQLFALYNEDRRDGWQANARSRYVHATQAGGRASDCLGCGRCMRSCPQHIDIVSGLRQVAARLER